MPDARRTIYRFNAGGPTRAEVHRLAHAQLDRALTALDAAEAGEAVILTVQRSTLDRPLEPTA